MPNCFKEKTKKEIVFRFVPPVVVSGPLHPAVVALDLFPLRMVPFLVDPITLVFGPIFLFFSSVSLVLLHFLPFSSKV